MNSSLKENNGVILSVLLISFCLCIIFNDGLSYMVHKWEADEYSHGYFIPIISLWLIWESKERLLDISASSRWSGVFMVLVGLLVGFMGELATLFVITQYAFLVTLYGFFLAFMGWKGIKLLWFPLTYLFFMMPLPNFLYNNLSSCLQLISSSLGVMVIRLFDISVNLQGNVIDLGAYQLQVVEACSGLRYLFPLASFGFLCAYFFQGKLWMRVIIFLSTLPITVIMNSFRIGIIGVLVNSWGIKQAEGFLHEFEGWVIFTGCLGMLFIEMWLVVKVFMKGRTFSSVFVVRRVLGRVNLEASLYPEGQETKRYFFRGPLPYYLSLLLLVSVVPFSFYLNDRVEVMPERAQFSHFPLQMQGWKGAEVGMEQKIINALKLDDYIIGNYTHMKSKFPLNLYMVYYASQRKGASIHSPKSCIPGDGWRISDFTQKTVPNVNGKNGEVFEVNRIIIDKGSQKQLVYYWFQQRGRVMTNEYLVKWYLFWDSLTKQRTDGALVRLTIPVSGDIAKTERLLDSFLAGVIPVLGQFIPD